MAENNKVELNADELKKINGGKSVITIMQDLLSLVSQYPEIEKIMAAYKSGDYETFLMLLQKFKMTHPELAYIFED